MRPTQTRSMSAPFSALSIDSGTDGKLKRCSVRLGICPRLSAKDARCVPKSPCSSVPSRSIVTHMHVENWRAKNPEMAGGGSAKGSTRGASRKFSNIASWQVAGSLNVSNSPALVPFWAAIYVRVRRGRHASFFRVSTTSLWRSQWEIDFLEQMSEPMSDEGRFPRGYSCGGGSGRSESGDRARTGCRQRCSKGCCF